MFQSSYPSNNTGEALVLVDQHPKLTRELSLLRRIGQNRFPGAVRQGLSLQRPQRGHILDDHKTEFIASLVEEFVLDFDLCKMLALSHDSRGPSSTYVLAEHVEAQALQHLQIVHHCFLCWGTVDTVRPESLVQGTKHEGKFAVQ